MTPPVKTIDDLFWALVDCLGQDTNDLNYAFTIADSVIIRLCELHSGELVYYPKGYTKLQRNAQIAAKFTGNNHKALAAEFGLSVKQVYVILKQKKNRPK